MRNSRELTLLSVVAPMYQEEGLAEEFHARVTAALDGLPFELVLVDDGSTDGTGAILERLAGEDDRVRVITLSRNFGHQAALSAGLDHAAGDVVVMTDADLQDPPGVILEMVDRWREGADVVYGVRRERAGETKAKLATARWFYALFSRMAQVDLAANAGDFRLMDRAALDALLALPERNRFLRGMTVWVGFTQTAVAYDRDARYAGETKYTWRRMFHFAFDAITSFSYAPLQMATLLGFLCAGLAFALIPLVIVAKIYDQFALGVPTMLVVVLLLGGIQLISTGIIGEYVGRIYDEVKGRPLYVVRSRRNVAVRPDPPSVPPNLPRARVEG